MLMFLTRKLCPLMSLALLSVACGKPITDPDTQNGNSTVEPQLPSSYVMRLDGSTNNKFRLLPMNAKFYLPLRLIVKAGNTAGTTVTVKYDAHPEDSDDFVMKCTYTPFESYYKLNKCVNWNDADLGDVTSEQFSVRKDEYIQMSLTGAPVNDLVIETVYDMDWI